MTLTLRKKTVGGRIYYQIWDGKKMLAHLGTIEAMLRLVKPDAI